MTREKNYERGAKAEERIKAYIQQWATAESTGKRYPDLLLMIGHQPYGVECKSLVAVNNANGGRKGNATISSAEMAGMNALVEQGITPCLIVEIRAPCGRACYSYFFIPWIQVDAKYSKRRPGVMALTFYWILQNGENLGRWLVAAKEGMTK